MWLFKILMSFFFFANNVGSYDSRSDLTIHDSTYLLWSHVRSQFWQLCRRMKHNFEADWRKKISTLCNTERKKKMWFSFTQNTQGR